MHSFRESQLPLPSANDSYADRSISAGGDVDDPSVYVENFDGFQWIHDATIDGFLNLRLSGSGEGLFFEPKPNGLARSSLTYRFVSYFPLQSVAVNLDADSAG